MSLVEIYLPQPVFVFFNSMRYTAFSTMSSTSFCGQHVQLRCFCIGFRNGESRCSRFQRLKLLATSLGAREVAPSVLNRTLGRAMSVESKARRGPRQFLVSLSKRDLFGEVGNNRPLSLPRLRFARLRLPRPRNTP